MVEFVKTYNKARKNMHRKQIDGLTVFIFLCVALIYSLLASVARVVRDESFFVKGNEFACVAAFFVNLILIGAITIGIELQYNLQLVEYTNWMRGMSSFFSFFGGFYFFRVVCCLYFFFFA